MVRERVVRHLHPLGYRLDEGLNATNGSSGDSDGISRGQITRAWARPLAMVLETDEQAEIAIEAMMVVDRDWKGK